MCKGNQKQTTTQTNAPDPQAMALYQRLLGRAEETANTPYTAYTGDLVAGINQQQQLGINNINAAQPLFNEAMSLSRGIASPLTQEEIQQYMDPFTQNVINTTQAGFANANEEARQKMLGSAAAQKALGGNRVGVAEGELARQQQMAQAPVIAQLQSQGYNTGLNTALQMKDLQSRGVRGMLQAGQGGLGAASAQLQAGTLEQQNQQQLLDALYGQWQQQQAYPFQTTQWLANLGTGVGSNMGGTGTTTTPGPNTGSQILGGITSGLGILGGMGLLNRGGRVNGRARGGVVPDNVIAESPESLFAQQEQLLNGNRAVQMFPPGTPELGVPEGMDRFESDRGAFHFNPDEIGAEDVASASAEGRENELLDLGPFSKEDIAKLVQQGSPLLVIIERDPTGTEVRAALGTPETVEVQKRALEEAKSPENVVTVEPFEEVLQARMAKNGGEGPAEGFAAGGAPKQLGFTPWGGASGVVPTPDFNMVRGKLPSPPSPARDQGGSPKVGDLSGLGKTLRNAFKPSGDGALYSEAMPAPGSSGGYRWGGVYVPVFGGMASGGGVMGLGLSPDILQDVYGIGGEVPGRQWGGRMEKVYENDEPSPLDPPSGVDRDLLIRGVLSEAGNQGPVGMQAVANVVRNRAVDGGYGGNEVDKVLTKPRQFEPFNTAEGRAKMRSYDPNSQKYQEAAEAVDRAYTGVDPTYGATHFYAPKAQAALGRAKPRWDDGTGVDIKDHRFFGGAGQSTMTAGRDRPEEVMAYAPQGDGSDKSVFSPEERQRVMEAAQGRVASADGVANRGIHPALDEHSAASRGGYNYRPAGYDATENKKENPWGSDNKLWPTLIAAGLGMMSSRSPSFGVGVGEGGLMGLQTYSQLAKGEQEQKLSKQRADLEARKFQHLVEQQERPYREMTAYQKASLLNKPDTANKLTNEIEQRKKAAITQGLDPKDPRVEAYILTGTMPRENQQPLTASDKKAILEADEAVEGAEIVINNLRKAKELSKQAYEGIGAAQRGYATSLWGSDEGTATVDLNNLVIGNALQQLKTIFGGNPTEGERKILMDIQGSANQTDKVRQGIFDRAEKLAQRRLQFNKQRAEELRGGSFYKPKTAPQKPSLEQFLEKARAANPGVSDEALSQYYRTRYGQ